MTADTSINPAELLALVGTPDCPIIIDVTTDSDFAEDPYLIPGAVRRDVNDAPTLAADLGDTAPIIVCQKGKKLSQGIAAWLRSDGLPARYLKGGNHAWRAHPNAPRIAANAIPAPVHGTTLWALPERPDPATLGSAWIIRRFIDREARLLFVEKDQIAGVAEKIGATPCPALQVLLSDTGLKTDPILNLADVLMGKTKPYAHPPGYRPLFDGLASTFPTDIALTDAAITVIDGLYTSLCTATDPTPKSAA